MQQQVWSHVANTDARTGVCLLHLVGLFVSKWGVLKGYEGTWKVFHCHHFFKKNQISVQGGLSTLKFRQCVSVRAGPSVRAAEAFVIQEQIFIGSKCSESAVKTSSCSAKPTITNPGARPVRVGKTEANVSLVNASQ